ncbi:MAG: YhgE/Pip domain-containing protein [Clostridiales bacterium]|nr:YhgE/Pip domain-containing protein [Clostridiales bacterium]
MEDCGINRNTFYYYFHDIPSLIEDMVMEEAERIIREYPSPETIEDLKSMWDPYGNLKNLPVAVVNEDCPVEYEGKTLNIGDEMVKNLRESDALDFRFMDEGQAQKGLADGSWYMVITIPENFSRNAATLLDEKPEKMELTFETNPGTNYIASKMGESAAEKLCEETASQVTETYTKILFEQLASVEDGIREAADGSRELADGISTAAGGSIELKENLRKLADSTLTFSDGAGQLTKGLKEYTGGVESVKEGASRLNTGTETMKEKIPELTEGIHRLQQGTETYTGGVAALDAQSEQLLDGSVKMNEGAEQLTEGLDTAENGTAQYVRAVDAFAENAVRYAMGTKQLADGAAQLEDLENLRQISEGISRLNASVTEGENSLKSGTRQLEDGLGNLYEQLQRISEETSDSSIREFAENMEKTRTGAQDAGEAVTQISMEMDGMADDLRQYAALAVSTQSSLTDITAQMESARTDLGSLPDTLRSLTGAAGKLYEGACQVSSGVNTTSEKLTELETATSGFPAAAQGVKSLEEGFETLTSGNEALLAGAKGLNKAGADLDDGLRAAVSGGDTLAEGMRSLDGGVRAYTGGVSLLARNSAALTGGTRQLLEGSDELISGMDSFAGGTESLYEGVSRLTQNSGQLTEGAKLLADGSEQIQTGAGRLYQGSEELEELDAGMQELMEGSETLAAALEDGAGDLNGQEFSEETISMFASPLEAKEKKITNVENNGHGMAPYMMSVGLWVGCLAFCLMYPLTQYTGRLKSGFSWWASKAVVLYPVAVLQGILLIVLLHVVDRFQPARMMETICFACLTAVSFTSIMYFFNITLGKVGSFLMLIFMVIQLSGSAGTYPVEISPPFVSRIHAFLPFTCTVDAFRSAISGGESILPSVTPLVFLTLVFTGLTILQFQHMARCRKTGKKLLIDWMEEKGLA